MLGCDPALSGGLLLISISLAIFTQKSFKTLHTVNPILRGHPKEGQKVSSLDR